MFLLNTPHIYYAWCYALVRNSWVEQSDPNIMLGTRIIIINLLLRVGYEYTKMLVKSLYHS